MQSKSVFQFLTLSVVLFPSCVAVNLCAGDDATFTCQTNATTITWAITPPAPEATTSCLALRGPPLNVITPSCGEMDEFTIEVSSAEEGLSTLSTESIAADLNGTRIRCLDGDFDSEVCIRDVSTPPRYTDITVSERDVGGGRGCVISVEWSEAVIACEEPQYVLLVTPPTPECQSGPEDCQLLTTNTRHNLTISVGQNYRITLRLVDFQACSTTSNSIWNILNPGIPSSCDTNLMYSPSNGSLTAVEIILRLTPLDGLVPETVTEYTVLIDDGVGPTVKTALEFKCSAHRRCSHTYYPGEGSRAEFGVTVEAAGCVTRQTVCREAPVYCPVEDLSDSLTGTKGVCGSVSGGGVCYSGDSVGSVAVFFCDDGYTLEGGDSTRECLSSGLWNGTTPQCVPRVTIGAGGAAASSDSTWAIVVVGVVCCVVFLTTGVLLGAVSLYLVLRGRGKLSGPAPSSTNPLPPPLVYEEVGVARDENTVKLTSNEAYGPIPKDKNIQVSPNEAYGKVRTDNSIELAPNEAYGPIPKDKGVVTSRNAAYGQVQL